ncbi:AAA family ATPase [Bosea vaviloviae]|uniref:AAA family ATPase n=1 Tax=Bosea vaviloviae TaxID=1526658 RepID=UPI0006BAB118|nr:AAA family ATPase [Bosea vaviloviae]
MLIALAGHAGSGKSTAIDILRESCRCGVVYLGDTVRLEVARRGLEPHAESERAVREELREREGQDAFARRSAHRIVEILNRGDVAFIDAVYHPQEYAFLAAEVSATAILLAIETSLETRIARLAERSKRPISGADLQRRDRYEIDTLRTGEVIAKATRIDNDGTLDELRHSLRAFMRDRMP